MARPYSSFGPSTLLIRRLFVTNHRFPSSVRTQTPGNANDSIVAGVQRSPRTVFKKISTASCSANLSLNRLTIVLPYALISYPYPRPDQSLQALNISSNFVLTSFDMMGSLCYNIAAPTMPSAKLAQTSLHALIAWRSFARKFRANCAPYLKRGR